ncbi:hypothetical protein DERP_008447 [Dermatophagoides pteronyssinus]|uniref:Uncharacterized protein n=1 Tax=Dermatophagoides pteronyssinus TaxID=6956 RepID=A0ABQ8IVM0_DERPT|nr:hypothetical protein DERP_008447 [Dermatophagoides pteronyssinus]
MKNILMMMMMRIYHPVWLLKPPPPSSSNVESKSSSTVNDLNNSLKIDSNYASKTVIVDTGYDTSAVRLIVNPENVFRARLRCSILVIPKKPNGLIVTLRKLHVRPGTDWLRISINNSSFTRTFSHIRINSERDSVAYVAHHGVLIEFATRTYLPKEEKVEIELILTSFREADLCDIDEEFDCGSFRCISNHYVCDGYNNCGDSRDETNCPMDNITTYLIVSTTLLLVAFIIFLCICYRCCFRTGKNHHNRQSGAYISPAYRNHHHKQYPYLRIRTNSTPVAPESFTNQQSRIRSQSIQSEADLPDSATNNSSNSAFRRFKLSGDSMPVLVPTAPNAFQPTANNYGSLGQTFFPPSYVSYQPYTITLTTGTNRIGLRPLRQLRRQNTGLLSSTLRNKTADSIAVHISSDQLISIGDKTITNNENGLEPIALVYLRSIGSMDFMDNRKTVKTLTDYIHNNLQIEPSRIRIILQNYQTDMVSVDGKLICDRLQ